MKHPLVYSLIVLLGVSCVVHVTDISLNCYNLSLKEGETFLLEASISPYNAANSIVIWSTSNPKVAIVNEIGEVRAVSEGNAIIIAKTDDGGCTAMCEVNVIPPYLVIDGQKCVDLGLSVKWAYSNVGASTPEQRGDFFAWGEVSPKTVYGYDYKYYDNQFRVTKYCVNKGNSTTAQDMIDGKTTLDLEDDAAHHYYGGGWRMPTSNEWKELQSSCTWKWMRLNDGQGYLITGKNGNQIFLPETGLMSNGNHLDVHQYWSSTLDITSQGNYNAYVCRLSSGKLDMGSQGRSYGLCVRGVIRK